MRIVKLIFVLLFLALFFSGIALFTDDLSPENIMTGVFLFVFFAVAYIIQDFRKASRDKSSQVNGPVKCSSCQNPIQEGERFCGKCGKAIPLNSLNKSGLNCDAVPRSEIFSGKNLVYLIATIAGLYFFYRFVSFFAPLGDLIGFLLDFFIEHPVIIIITVILSCAVTAAIKAKSSKNLFEIFFKVLVIFLFFLLFSFFGWMWLIGWFNGSIVLNIIILGVSGGLFLWSSFFIWKIKFKL
jgi:hypothetical protein